MAHVQSRSASGSGTSLVLAYLSNPAAGNFLAAGVGNGDDGDVLTTVNDNNSNTWAEAIGATVNAQIHASIRYAMNVNAGATTVTATFTSAEFASNICIAEYTEIALTAALDQTNSGSGFNQSVTTGSVTPTQADELVIAVACSERAGIAWALDTDFDAERADTGSNRPMQYIDDIIASTSSLTSTHAFTDANGNNIAVIATFKIAAIPATCVLTGTMITGGVTEAEMVSG